MKKEPKESKPLPDFNLDTRPMKYFDASLDVKSKKEQERDFQNNR